MGLMPSAAAGTSPGGIAIELPAPINYDTDNLKVEAGYVKNPLSLSFIYLYTRFQNDNEQFIFPESRDKQHRSRDRRLNPSPRK